ncbi:hypothetical protein SynA1560_02961 [Synechococcus sp. A15-60]|nr:hypothetical protein SynA1560_02961 [Synechococcus sp. A15-60]
MKNSASAALLQKSPTPHSVGSPRRQNKQQPNHQQTENDERFHVQKQEA